MTILMVTKNPGISVGVSFVFKSSKLLSSEASFFNFAVVLLAVELRLRQAHVLQRLCR